MKNKMLISVIALAAIVGLVGPSYSLAQTTTASTSAQVQAMLDQIKNLQTQIQALQAARDQLVKAQGAVSQTLSLVRSLRQGMSGDDVKALQTILAADTSIYPEGLVTGFYGRLTSDAVKKFQNKHGIEALGFVGPKTLKKLNEAISESGLSEEDQNVGGVDQGKKLCAKVPPGHLIAAGWLRKNDKPIVPVCQILPKGISDKESDSEWKHASTTPDTTAPVISGVSAANLVATSTNIIWTTNELSNSKVWYGTLNPLPLTTASSTLVESSVFVTNHNIPVSGLTASTTYYYVVGSTNAVGNTATSSQNSFTTLVN